MVQPRVVPLDPPTLEGLSMFSFPPRLAGALAFAAVAAACSAPASPPPQALPPVTPIMMPPAINAENDAAGLAGRTWSWQETQFATRGRVAPDAPERYTLEFLADGRVQLRADCNRGGAQYQMAANRGLTLSPAATTKMGCPPGSQDSEFLRQLAQVDGYRIEAGNLVLTLKLDSGSMRFVPLAR
jgi:heat shock protein HslJ